jgi:hypothetical protein
MRTEHDYFLMRQENLYYRSNLKDKKWYRKIIGGEWKLIKLGKDTPYIGMFCTWTHTPIEWWSGHVEILESESYPESEINTRWGLNFAIIKYFFKIV